MKLERNQVIQVKGLFLPWSTDRLTLVVAYLTTSQGNLLGGGQVVETSSCCIFRSMSVFMPRPYLFWAAPHQWMSTVGALVLGHSVLMQNSLDWQSLLWTFRSVPRKSWSDPCSLELFSLNYLILFSLFTHCQSSRTLPTYSCSLFPLSFIGFPLNVAHAHLILSCSQCLRKPELIHSTR